MPRLRNRATGSVVNVDEETAERISIDYEPVDEPKTTTTKKAASSSKSEK